MKNQLSTLINISWQAADAIMQFYDEPINVIQKEDASPLTEADKASDTIITRGLQANFPHIRIVSEEDTSTVHDNELSSPFFLVDPLDGTKEFIKHNGEFTTNIALIENGIPVAGVVCAPAQDIIYYGAIGLSAFKMKRGSVPIPISVSRAHENNLVLVGSRSHGSLEEIEALFENRPISSWLSVGSSLKFCLVAEGAAHVYPRLGTTMEWDTAAGQAVLTAAGGTVISLETNKPLVYGKPGLKNPHFMATNGSFEFLPLQA